MSKYKTLYHDGQISGWACLDCGARIHDSTLHNRACNGQVRTFSTVNDTLDEAQRLIRTYSGTIGVGRACAILEALKEETEEEEEET